jgi:hypothetical protein
VEERLDELALEVDAPLVPRGDQLVVGARRPGEDSGAGAAGDATFDSSGLVVKAVSAGPEAGSVEITVGVKIDEASATAVNLSERLEQ